MLGIDLEKSAPLLHERAQCHYGHVATLAASVVNRAQSPAYDRSWPYRVAGGAKLLSYDGLVSELAATETSRGRVELALRCPAARNVSLWVVRHTGSWRKVEGPFSRNDLVLATDPLRSQGWVKATKTADSIGVEATTNPDVGLLRITSPVVAMRQPGARLRGRQGEIVADRHVQVSVVDAFAVNLPALRLRVDELGLSNEDVEGFLRQKVHGRDSAILAPVASSLVLEQTFSQS